MEELGMASAPGYLFGIVEQGDEISEQVKAGCLGVTRSKQSFLACYRGRIKCVEVRHRKLWVWGGRVHCIALRSGPTAGVGREDAEGPAAQPWDPCSGHRAHGAPAVGSAAANLVRIRTQKQVI